MSKKSAKEGSKKPGHKEPPPLNIDGHPLEAFDHFLNNRVEREIKHS